MIVFTDGVDTSSELTPRAGGGDRRRHRRAGLRHDRGVGRGSREGSASEQAEGPLRDLSRATGGDLFVTSAPAHESVAARQIVDELRHQYVLAFAASPERGLAAADGEDDEPGS